MTKTNTEKVVSMRVLEVKLYETIKAQAKAEGMQLKDWIDRALHNELARSRMQRSRLEAHLAEE
jgi:predicted DNA binding CopG/RHH family protein